MWFLDTKKFEGLILLIVSKLSIDVVDGGLNSV